MKKFLFASLFATTVCTVSAQKTTFGIKGGLNLGSVNISLQNVQDGQRNLTTYNGGVVADIGISRYFSIQPQLVFNGKGFKFFDVDHTHTITFHSLDLPVYAVYKLPKGFFAGAGPGVGINLSGKNETTKATEVNVTYKFGKDNGEFQRFDVSANFLVGYQHKSGLFLSTSYTKGLTNQYNASGIDWKFNVWSFSVGYAFHKKSK